MPTSAFARTRTDSSREACARATTSRSSRATASTGRSLDFALAQIGAVGIPVYASSSARDVGYLLAHSEAVGDRLRGRRAAREGRGVSERAPGAAARPHVPRPRRARRARPRLRAHATRPRSTTRRPRSTKTTSSRSSTRPGRPGRRRAACSRTATTTRWRPSSTGWRRRTTARTTSMLLYLPLAHNYGRLMLLLGAHVGFTIAFLADPLRVAEALPAGAADAAAERPARVREGARGRAVALRRGDGRQDAPHRLGASDRPRGEPARGAGEAGPGAASRRKHRDRRPARVRARCASRSAAACGCPARAAPRSRRRSPSSSTPSASASSRATASRSARPRAARTGPDVYRFGSVGQPLPGFEVRIADDGEIEVRSETVFQGYFKDPEATGSGARRRRLAQDRRHRRARRRRLPPHHRPQEGHPRHGRREERRAAEHRERPQDVEVRLAGARRRRPRGRTSRR